MQKYITSRIKSFKYAFNGIYILFKEEPNAGIHFFACILVIIAGFVFKVSATEWIMLIFAIALVFAMEALNAAIENLADRVDINHNELIKKTKDLAAAAVLLSAIAAVIIGVIIFLPKILALLNV